MSGLDEVAAWLQAGAGTGAPANQVIETHAARVFLIGDAAYKIKKPVDFGYLDFSTPALRAVALHREYERNRATAPAIYQGVRQVTRQADGRLGFDGDGAVLEAVLAMRAFDPQAVLSNRPHVVCGDFAEALGRRIADMHAAAEVKVDRGGEAGLAFVIRSNAEHSALRTACEAIWPTP